MTPIQRLARMRRTFTKNRSILNGGLRALYYAACSHSPEASADPIGIKPDMHASNISRE